MAIGLFDSGVGGLTIHRAVIERLPQADVIYLADQAHMPYGVRSGEEIVQLTRGGCERLFLEGCDLVILACNTASAMALRTLQHSWLPGLRERLGRAVNVLGIIVPTIETVTGRPWRASQRASPVGLRAIALGGAPAGELVGVFATQATARSAVFEIEIAKRRSDLRVFTEPCAGLAGLIERGAARAQLLEVIEAHVRALMLRIGGVPDKVILGSTHYEVAAELFFRALPSGTALIQQPRATADALEAYLERHREYRIGTQGVRRYLTTGEPGAGHAFIEAYCGEPLRFERVR